MFPSPNFKFQISNLESPMYLASAPLAATAERLRLGVLNLPDHINAICDRIDAIEPDIQALLPEPDRRERLLQEAKELAQRFPGPEERPPLYGVLLGVKDIFRVDGFLTQAGSKLPAELFAGSEAACVTRLKRAGALILGKTVTTEFAYFEPGPTRNPHNTVHTPGGSSSGSAAAIASGMCQLALGTQTIGSVIRPAAFCGILGFKPSFNRIPSEGLIFFSRSADHVGFFTQDIEGLQLAASVLCNDWKTEMDLQDFQKRLPVLGVPVGPYLEQASEEGRAIFEAHLKRFEQRGYRVKRVQAFDNIEAINHRHRQLTAAEAAQEHAEWFGSYQQLYRKKTKEVILTGQQVSNAEVERFREGQLHLRTQLAHLQKAHAIDLWLSPAALGAAPEGLASTGSPDMNLPWTHAGLPAVTIPSGVSQKGLPVGLQIVGTFMGDERLLVQTQQLLED